MTRNNNRQYYFANMNDKRLGREIKMHKAFKINFCLFKTFFKCKIAEK